MFKYSQLVVGSKAFVEQEPRDAMYKVSAHLIEEFWGKPRDITDALGVLLLTWNQSFYRFGSFDFYSLENCLVKNNEVIEQYRNRDILSYSVGDEQEIKMLFTELLDALRNEHGRSPVAVAKALHLLAPNFFPLWDTEIAKEGYQCFWGTDTSGSASKYLVLMNKTQTQAKEVTRDYTGFNQLDIDGERAAAEEISKNLSKPFKKSILKLIDEYNYAKYTKGWI